MPRGDLVTGQNAVLFWFEDCDLTVSDMTFDITAYSPAEPWLWHGADNWDLGAVLWVSGTDFDSAIERVAFKGHRGTFYEFLGDQSRNLRVGVVVGGFWQGEFIDGVEAVYVHPASGRLEVASCYFSHVLRRFQSRGFWIPKSRSEVTPQRRIPRKTSSMQSDCLIWTISS